MLQRPAHQRIATDTERNNVAAYGVFSGTHTGPGGPCEPTGKKTISDYVYVMQFTGDKISHITKILAFWNGTKGTRLGLNGRYPVKAESSYGIKRSSLRCRPGP